MAGLKEPQQRVTQLARRAAGATRHPAGHPPPGLFRPGAWRSPLRGLWLTSVLAAVLLAGLAILTVTGLLSYAAYDPLLPGNDQTPGASLLKFYLFVLPVRLAHAPVLAVPGGPGRAH